MILFIYNLSFGEEYYVLSLLRKNTFRKYGFLHGMRQKNSTKAGGSYTKSNNATNH